MDMVRSPKKKNENKLGINKGKWTPEEDRLLIAYISRFGIWNWGQMSRFAGLSRSGKSCRLRWMNYLSPNVKHGNFTLEEEETIINMYQVLGSGWSVIAKELPGRTDNEIKNYWHTNLKKRFMKKNSDPNMAHESPPFYSSTTDGETSSPEEYSLPINVQSNGSNPPTTFEMNTWPDSQVIPRMLENLSISEEEKKVIDTEFDDINIPDIRDMLSILEDPIFQF